MSSLYEYQNNQKVGQTFTGYFVIASFRFHPSHFTNHVSLCLCIGRWQEWGEQKCHLMALKLFGKAPRPTGLVACIALPPSFLGLKMSALLLSIIKLFINARDASHGWNYRQHMQWYDGWGLQPSSTLPTDYSKAPINNALSWYGEYEEFLLKFIFVQGLSEYIHHSFLLY